MNIDNNCIKQLIQQIYEETQPQMGGKVADYIPQLAKVNPELFGVSVCFSNGEIFGLGDDNHYFCLQSCSKPLNYCISRQQFVSTNGKTLQESCDIHRFVGYEPSGQSFNSFILNKQGLPHNPMINAGAIMVSSLIKSQEEPAHRFGHIKDFYQKLAGNQEPVGFDNGVFLSEKHHADRNISLAYYMRENNAFPTYPTQSEIQDHLDLYFQCCSVTINAKMGSIISATLANGGVCPVSGERIIEQNIVKDCLSLMYGCGMYDFSGQFAFKIGLPAKSGVSGCLLLVVPGVCGICIFSPKLDEMGNTVRGVEFCRRFSEITQSKYHIFNHIMNYSGDVSDESQDPSVRLGRFISAASQGDLSTVQKYIQEINPLEKDYDGRTALHLAAAEGHVGVVQLILQRIREIHQLVEEDPADTETLKTLISPKDRWGNTPQFEASRFIKDESDASRVYVEIYQLLS